MRISEKSISLPVVLATLFLMGGQLSQAREVVLYNNNWQKQVRIGRVVAEETTVGRFKEIIVERLGEEYDKLRLIGHHNNPLLDDDKFVADSYDINEIVMVKLCDDLTNPGPVTVDFDNKKIQVVANKNNTLGWLKKEVLGQDNTQDYKVFFEEVLLDDEEKTLAEYKFYKGARVLFYKSDGTFEVTVKSWLGSRKTLEASLKTSLKDLKEMLEEEDVELGDLLFLHNNIVIKDENKKLFTYSKGFYQGLVLKVVLRLNEKGGKLIFFYKKQLGKIQKYDIFVKSSNTVGHLKTLALSADRSVPLERMDLYYQGEKMENDTTLVSNFDIYPRAWIEVRMREIDPSTIQKRY